MESASYCLVRMAVTGGAAIAGMNMIKDDGLYECGVFGN